MQGRKVLNYTLLRLLGRGGMAEVWYAENRIGNVAAVKILNKDLSLNEPIVERFLNEAKVTVQLKHPNIRQVIDYDELDGRPCMVMEYLEGGDLGSRMRSGERFTDAQLRKWWDQLVSALNYTHAQGIVHRDIKPSNIFISKAGDVKLLDFGIAKVRDSITSTQTGTTMGTLMYMSPEQADDAKHVDGRSDIYSLAVSFVSLMQGHAPYDDSSESQRAILNHIAEHELNMDGVPDEWQRFLKPYLAKNPADRPKLVPFSAQAMPEEEAVSDSKTLADNTLVEQATSREPSKPKPAKPAVASPRNPRKADAQRPVPNARKRKIPRWVWIVGGITLAVILAFAIRWYWPKTSMEQTSNGDYVVSVGNVTFTMKKVEGGSFNISEQGFNCESDEKSPHLVTVSDFWIGETEVTQALWKAVMGRNPNSYGVDDRPERVSWRDCQKFIWKLNALTGKKFRLLTDAEWEYAARGGKHHSDFRYSGSDNIDEVAWYTDNSGGETHPVKGKKPNALGLYDMSGNVWEWCEDWYNSEYCVASSSTDPRGPSHGLTRVLRGGSASDDASFCQVAYRNSSSPGNSAGFRLALVH